jgi:hypothetical protein
MIGGLEKNASSQQPAGEFSPLLALLLSPCASRRLREEVDVDSKSAV